MNKELIIEALKNYKYNLKAGGNLVFYSEKIEDIKTTIKSLENSIQLTWCIEDIQNQFKEMKDCDSSLENITLDTIDCKEILKRIQHNHDCSFGVTWDTITYQIKEYLN